MFTADWAITIIIVVFEDIKAQALFAKTQGIAVIFGNRADI